MEPQDDGKPLRQFASDYRWTGAADWRPRRQVAIALTSEDKDGWEGLRRTTLGGRCASVCRRALPSAVALERHPCVTSDHRPGGRFPAYQFCV